MYANKRNNKIDSRGFMIEQEIIYANDDYSNIKLYLKKNKVKKIFLVCENFVSKLDIGKFFLNLDNIIVDTFSEFEPNPLYESVEKGVLEFQKKDYDMILSIGGGSSIDVSKCIKLFGKMKGNLLASKIIYNDIPLVAIPTTAGTGSEATKFAVIYCNGEKKSVEDDNILPNIVIFDSKSLKSLPYYQRCCTMLDALCHSLESFWSVNSNEESRKYSKEALSLIMKYKDEYLSNTNEGNRKMLLAANTAGKAINITRTTAGHAMCYKLTSLYKISHGHAAFLCVSKLYPYMINNISDCIDKRGEKYLKGVFNEIKKILNCETHDEVITKLNSLKKNLNLPKIRYKESDYEILSESVNVERLANNPISLNKDAINTLYHEILKEEKNEN